MINLDLRSEGEDFRSVLTPLLQAMGAVLVMRRNENARCKIALQPIGLDQAASSALTINSSDWLTDDPPKWSTYEDIVTQIEINFDYDVNEQKLRTKRVFNNQEAINRYNNEPRVLSWICLVCPLTKLVEQVEILFLSSCLLSQEYLIFYQTLCVFGVDQLEQVKVR